MSKSWLAWARKRSRSKSRSDERRRKQTCRRSRHRLDKLIKKARVMSKSQDFSRTTQRARVSWQMPPARARMALLNEREALKQMEMTW